MYITTKNEKKLMSVRIDIDDYNFIKEFAEKNCTTVHGFMNDLIDDFIYNEKRNQKKSTPTAKPRPQKMPLFDE